MYTVYTGSSRETFADYGKALKKARTKKHWQIWRSTDNVMIAKSADQIDSSTVYVNALAETLLSDV